MPNRSKVKDRRFWRRWYASGAVAQKQYPQGALYIEAMGIHVGGPAAGHTTLSLGARRIAQSAYAPLCAVVVPSDPAKYQLGAVLSEIPKNAVPADVFFG